MFGLKIIKRDEYENIKVENEELKITCESLNNRLEREKDTIKDYERALKGESVCGDYCQKCIYGMKKVIAFGVEVHTCTKAVRCKHFERKENG